MIIDNRYYEPHLPSENLGLFDLFINKSIINITRLSWHSLEECRKEYGSDYDKLFSRVSGEIWVEIENNSILACRTEPSQRAVYVWLEKDEFNNSRLRPKSLDEMNRINLYDKFYMEKSIFPFNAKDEAFTNTYWHTFIGSIIDSIHIIYDDNIELEQKGLLLVCSNGSELFMTHGLHDNSDDTSLIRLNDVDKRFKGRLRYLDTGKLVDFM
jgi:hypothetical protein